MTSGAYLSDAKLFSGALPADWKPLVDLITEMEALVTADVPAADKTSADRRERAARLRASILAEARNRHEKAPSALETDADEHKRWFTEAALLWMWFADSCGKVRRDQVGSATLGKFPIDFDPTAVRRDEMRAALCRAFGWSVEELGHLEDRQRHMVSNLEVKRAITAELAAMIDEGGEAASAELMNQIFGAMPWKVGDVSAVITTSTVFFCIPAEGEALTTDGYAGRPDAEREQIAGFIVRMNKAAMSIKNVRFPAFGMYDRAIVDPALWARLEQAVRREPGLEDVDAEVIRKTLPSMVLIVPTPDAEKYLIHDSWGHGWQETLCEFEWLFHEFRELTTPLEPAAWVGAFRDADGKTVLEPAALAGIVEADLRRRIRIGVNLVIAEALADLMEYKYGRFLEPLPSSSLVPTGVMKIDLSIVDSRRIRRLWSRPYRKLGDNEATRAAFMSGLGELGLPADGLEAALDSAVAAIVERFGGVFEHTDPPPANPGEIPVNIVHKLAIGVATLEAAVIGLLERGEDRYAALKAEQGDDIPRWRCPAACIDLLALVTAWVYEQDRLMHLWHLDELVADELLPSLIKLEHALTEHAT